MIRNLKALVVAAMAILAIGAVGASAASAENPEFTSEGGYPAFGHGESGNHVFEAAGVEVECNEATFSGSLGSASETLTIIPIYTDCEGFFGIDATVTGFGHHGETDTCDYLLHTTTGPAATVDIVCDKGAEITIDSNPCTVHIGPQTGLKTIGLTNNTPSSGQVTADIDVSGIHGTMTRNNFLCPGTPGTFNNGTYKGTLALSGTNEAGEPINIDVG